MKFSRLLGPLAIGLTGLAATSCESSAYEQQEKQDAQARQTEIKAFAERKEAFVVQSTKSFQGEITHAMERVDSVLHATPGNDADKLDAVYQDFRKTSAKDFAAAHPAGERLILTEYTLPDKEHHALSQKDGEYVMGDLGMNVGIPSNLTSGIAAVDHRVDTNSLVIYRINKNQITPLIRPNDVISPVNPAVGQPAEAMVWKTSKDLNNRSFGQ